MAAALSVAELLDALGDPACAERWSPLCAEGVLAVELCGGPPPAPELLARLRRLPAVTIGVGAPAAAPDSLAPPPDSLAAALDVLVADAAALAALRAAVAANPLASLTLVQLLRWSGALHPADAVLAESLAYSALQSGPEFAAWLKRRPPRRPRAPEPGAALRVSRCGKRLMLQLNRPAKRNAFSAEMRDALCEALQLALRDTALRVELRGAGAAFCSGGDLDEFGTLPDPATAHAIRTTRSPALLLAACAPRASAWLHGACVGAGVELPAFCARVAAHPGAFFALPEVGMGLVPGAGGTASLPRRIGRQRTAWLALSGARIDAGTALHWGLVDEITATPPAPPAVAREP